MNISFSLTRFCSFIIAAIATVCIFGCAHQSFTSGDSSAMVSEMLDQINTAIAEAKSTTGDVPQVTSVEVDLQLGTTTGANATLPLGIVFPLGAQESTNRLHKVSLTFTPKPISGTQAITQHNTALTTAIEKIYLSVSQANQHYQFQKGSMQIQCTLTSGVSVSTGQPGNNESSRSPSAANSAPASPSVILTPLSFDASLSSQSIQTIILTFGPSSIGATSAETVTPPASTLK